MTLSTLPDVSASNTHGEHNFVGIVNTNLQAASRTMRTKFSAATSSRMMER